MAASIGQLRAVLSAHTQKFNSNIQGARKQITGFRASTGLASKALSRLGTALVAFVGFRAITSQIKQTLEFMDQIGKLSDRLGASTQFLAGMTHAAQIYGTTQETVIKGLQDFTRRLAEANAGYGEAVRGLGSLKLSAKELAGLPLEQAFYKTAQGISELTNKTEQARVAYTLFGRSGREMMSMLQGNQDELKKTVKEFGYFGREHARMAEEVNDAWVRMKASIKTHIGLQVAGYLTLYDLISKGPIAVNKEITARYKAATAAREQAKIEREKTVLMARQVELAKERTAEVAKERQEYQTTVDRFRTEMELQDRSIKERREALLLKHDPFYRYKKGLEELKGLEMPLAFEKPMMLTPAMRKAIQREGAQLKADFLQATKSRIRTGREGLQLEQNRFRRLFEQGAFKDLGGRETYLRELKARGEEYRKAVAPPKTSRADFAEAAVPGSQAAYSAIVRRLKPRVQDEQLQELKKQGGDIAANRRANEEQLHKPPQFNLVTIPG